MSHPMWVRGLKLGTSPEATTPPLVAPHVGAWIETSSSVMFAFALQVAPHVGAWIETS